MVEQSLRASLWLFSNVLFWPLFTCQQQQGATHRQEQCKCPQNCRLSEHAVGIPHYHRQQDGRGPCELPVYGVCSLALPQSLGSYHVCTLEGFVLVAPFPAPPHPDSLLLSPRPCRQSEVGLALRRHQVQLPSSRSSSSPWEAHLCPAMCRRKAHICCGPTGSCQEAPAKLLILDFIPKSGVSLCFPRSSRHMSTPCPVVPSSLSIGCN